MAFLFKKNKEQIKAIFDWLGEVINRGDLILLEQERKRQVYYFEFPLKFGDKPKKAKTFDKNNLAFLVKFPPSGLDSGENRNEWQAIFKSPELEIYENKKRFGKKQFKPLRRGLNDEQKRIALKIARKSLEIFLREKRMPEIGSADFDFVAPFSSNLKTDVGVALWMKGLLRGSHVSAGRPLGEGIVAASVEASRDSAFKPLKAEEIAGTRIEITVCGDLKIPLSRNLIEKNEIFYNKGYFLQKRGKVAWSLPQIFNTGSFRDLKDLIRRLAEKVSPAPEEIFDKETRILIFEVDDFIDDRKGEQFLILDGPVAEFKEEPELKKTAEMTADWLLKVQEPDGNFIPIFNPLTGETTQIDWSRSALSAWSLIEFGKLTGKSDYIEAGRKNLLFLKKYLLEESMAPQDIGYTIMSLTFLGEMSLSLGYWQESLWCGSKILEHGPALKFSPIIFSQAGSFLTGLSRSDKKFFEPALKLANLIREEFENNLKEKMPMGLSTWAGMVDLFLKIFEVTGDSSYLEIAKKTADWLLSYQLDNGAFKSATNSNFVFTRGTGKITDVLGRILLLENKQVDSVFDRLYYKGCMEKAFGWLGQMQYLSENSYFVPQKNLVKTIGGFRHDYFNPDIWIDSAGHFLLGVSRFLKADS